MASGFSIRRPWRRSGYPLFNRQNLSVAAMLLHGLSAQASDLNNYCGLRIGLYGGGAPARER